MSSDAEWLLAGMDKVWAPVATPLGFALAVMVTGHALLTKREVAACVGWIGLAWVAPTWGALFYFMFGINRVVRRARRARPPRTPKATPRLPIADIADHLAPLERAIRRITNRLAEGNNAITLLRNGDEAYPAMLAAIGAARRSVALSTYIMADDAVGRRFAEALAAAEARGVAVRVLIDGIGSGYFPPIARRLRRAGLRVALFMHSAMPWRMPFLNLRSHKKLLIVDGAVGFTGGMNIAADNVLGEPTRFPIADTHFRLEGPVVAQLMDAFAQDWAFTSNEDLDGEAWFPDLQGRGDTAARVIASGPDQDLEKIQAVLLEALACAQSSIRLMTPYFLPSEDVLYALALAAMRGVHVDIVVPRRSNHRVIDLAMRAHVGPLFVHGVRIWLGDAPFDHSKLLVVDERWCLIGSANWDTRSLRLNFELDVECYSAALAAQLTAVMQARQNARLHSHDLTGRSLPVQLRDAAFRLLLPYI